MCFSRSTVSSGIGSPESFSASATFASSMLDGHHQVADQLAFVGVGQLALVAQLVDLAEVVQEGAHQQQVAVDLRDSRGRCAARPPSG